MEFNELMNAFAAKCGLAGVEAEDGCVVLEFNDIPVAFMENDAFESLVLRAVIGAPPPETDGSLAKAMLRANHALCNACGATLCQDPETKEYAAVLTIPLSTADAELLAKAVGNIVKTVNTWQGVVASGTADQSADSRLYV